MQAHARRQRTLPLACAVALTLAAGLSLAEEHARHRTEAQAAVALPAAASHASPAERHGRIPPATHPVSAVGHSAAPTVGATTGATGTTTGVGSRALTGDETQAPATDRQETAPGIHR